VAWRFERGEPLDDAFRRVAGEEIARIRDGLADPKVARAQAIHQARRGFKRMRALLRLARPAFGESYADADRRWRDAGRLLASSRDATVMIETFDRVVVSNGLDLPAAPLGTLRERVGSGSAPADGADEPTRVQAAIASLDAAREEVKALDWPTDKGPVCAGLKKSQSHLRKRWKAASDDPQPKKLHAWRKRVKNYTAQVSLVRTALSHDLKVCRADSKELADILGEEHDLSVLREKLDAVRGNPELRRTRDRLVQSIDQRRAELCEAAFEKGTALSSRRPKAFAEEIGSRLT
jgi:CHAD domain-containing protein